MSTNNNAQAFPSGNPTHGGSTGMTLQHYFAAKVLQGFCANPSIFAPDCRQGWNLVNCTDEQLVGYARELSEKMLQALKEVV